MSLKSQGILRGLVYSYSNNPNRLYYHTAAENSNMVPVQIFFLCMVEMYLAKKIMTHWKW